MTALTLASLITLSSNAKGYIHPCGFGPHWFCIYESFFSFSLASALPLFTQGQLCLSWRTLGQILLDCFLGYFTFGEELGYQSNSEVSKSSLEASGWKEADQVRITVQANQCSVDVTQAWTSDCASWASPLIFVYPCTENVHVSGKPSPLLLTHRKSSILMALVLIIQCSGYILFFKFLMF